MSILQMSLSGTVLIAAIIVIRALFLHKLPKKTFTILWTLAAIRLLLPFSVTSPFSLYSWLPEANDVAGKYIKTAISFEQHEKDDVAKGTIKGVLKESRTERLRDYENLAQYENTEKPSFSLDINIRIVGSVICAIVFIILYIRSIREFKTSLPVNNEFIKNWLAEHSLKRKISVRYSDRISAPLSYGLFKPMILLPKKLGLEDTELVNYILTHEYIHIKRFDILAKAILIMVVCMHWFNPAVWVMFILFNRDIELSCDEAVIRILGEQSKESYAYALIDMEAKKSGFMPLCNNFSKNAVKERIISIMKIKKISSVMILFAVMFIVGIATVFMTSAKEKKQNSVSEKSYKKIDELKFKGYEEMLVTEYSDRVLKATDSKEYMEALEKIADNKDFYEKRNTDKEAGFFYYVLTPMLTGKWKDQTMAGNIKLGKGFPVLEYAINIDILNHEKLTVGEYKTAIESIQSGVQSLKKKMIKKNIKTSKAFEKEFKTGLTKILEKISNKNLSLTLEGTSELEAMSEMVSKETGISEKESEKEASNQREVRRIAPATKEDYNSLFKSLKKSDYKNMKVEDFNKALAKWASAGDGMRMDRINEDIIYEDFAVNLTKEEKEFVTTTIFLSGLENAEKFKALHTGKKEKLPVISLGYSENTKIDNERYESYDCSYLFSYDIVKKNKITVGKRDKLVKEFMFSAGKIWNEPEFSDLQETDKADIIEKLNKIAKDHSGSEIIFKILEDQVVFDKINEKVE